MDVTTIAAPRIGVDNLLLLLNSKLRIFLNPNRIQVEVTAKLQEVGIRINKDGLVATLIKVTASFVATIVIDRIRSVKMLHKALRVCFRSPDKKVKMVVHEYIGMYLNAVKLYVRSKDLQKFDPIMIVAKNFPFFITTAGYVVPSTRVFYPERSSHGDDITE